MYNFAKLFSLSQQQTFVLYYSHIYCELRTKIRIYRKQNTTTTQLRDGFANETISQEGFAGFVKPVSDSTSRLHKTQKSETGFG